LHNDFARAFIAALLKQARDDKRLKSQRKAQLTIKLFEEPLDAAESAPQLDVSIASRIVAAGLASIVAVIPALTAAVTAYRVTRLYAGMKNAETAGAEYITSGLDLFNTPLVIALGISALLAFVIALILAVDPKRRLAAVGLPFSIGIPLIAAMPALLLWSVETTSLEIMSGRIMSGSVEEIAAKISLLLMGAMVSGVFTVGIAFVCSIVSLILPVSRRTDPLALSRAFVWAVTGVLLLVFAGAYFVVV
jgi:hypothetical protein